MISQLPENRRAVYGRTYSRQFRHADFDPIERPARWGLTLTDALGAIALGLGLVALVLYGLGALWV